MDYQKALKRRHETERLVQQLRRCAGYGKGTETRQKALRLCGPAYRRFIEASIKADKARTA